MTDPGVPPIQCIRMPGISTAPRPVKAPDDTGRTGTSSACSSQCLYCHGERSGTCTVLIGASTEWSSYLSRVQRRSLQVRKRTVEAAAVLSSPHTCLSHPPKQHVLSAFIFFFALCCNQQVLGKAQCSPFQTWHHDRTKWTLNVLCISCRVSGSLSFLDK